MEVGGETIAASQSEHDNPTVRPAEIERQEDDCKICRAQT